MKRLLVLVTVALVATSVVAGLREIRPAADPVPDRFIVVLNDDVPEFDIEVLADDLVRGVRGRRDFVFQSALKGFVATMSPERALRIAANPLVKYVEQDGYVSINATQTSAVWGLDRIDQRDLPLSGSYTYNYTGSGVRAYIIDTGILASHTEFGGRVVSGYTAISDGRGTTDCNGHGTHVAGTVGGSTYGVAKSVTLVPVRVLDCNGSGTNSGVIAGVDWVTSNHAAGAPAVANMSLGGGASQSIDDAVNRMINDGVTTAVAAGNDYGQNACNYSPARVTNAITVGSTTSSDARSDFSNIGSCLDIFAPGSSIKSAWYTSNTATNTISGTSMATPHVAGVAALYLQSNTGASPSTVWTVIRDSSTPNKVTNAGSGSPNRLLYSLLTSGGGGGTTSQLFKNPGFESGNDGYWKADAYVIDSSSGAPARSGSWKAWLNGYGSSNSDYLYQDVTIPSNATAATLIFYINIDTDETTTSTAYDKLTVTVRNTSNSVLQTLATYSNLNKTSGYVQKSFDLLAYKGTTVRIHFYGTEDSSLQTSFLIDDTALNVTQ